MQVPPRTVLPSQPQKGAEGRVIGYGAGLIGEHASMDALRRLIAKVGRSPTRAVLIYGETGTGKGLVARMVHQQSPRGQREFVDVNCAAIPPSLLESELFGHERGAFTGATAKKTGLIEVASGGSLFLDEIREMAPMLQAKLLTLLDTQRFRRIGSVRPIEVDVRFIAATNRILFAEVKQGRFREDLYYRLQVVSINIPPLRERGDDVLVLTEHFLAQLGRRYGRVVKGLEPEAAAVFRAYAWPGNVRELENLLERIVVLEEDPVLRVSQLPARILREVPDLLPRRLRDEVRLSEPASAGGDFHEATAAFQRRLIEEAMSRAGGSQGAAAKALGLSRHALRHQMMKLGLR